MKSVFHICNCVENCQVKYTTCTLLDIALTWWNFHVKTVGIDVAYAMTWKELMKMITEVYCPRNGIQKMENELWNLIVKDNDVEGNHRQQQNKRQEVGSVYITGTGNKTCYAGTLPLCDKCKLYHHGPCPVNVETVRKSATKQETVGPLPR
ncbi:hypothetical protein Tco_0335129 [Tanacetum coccineum]